MISVELNREHYGLKVEGHAVDDRAICAAVSMLSHLYASYVKLLAAHVKYLVNESPGRTVVEAVPDEEGIPPLDMLFSVIAEGFFLLANDYGEELEITYTGGYIQREFADIIKSTEP